MMFSFTYHTIDRLEPEIGSIQFGQFHTKFINSYFIFYQLLFTYYFLPWVGTPSNYLEYLLRIVYTPISIVVEEIFPN